MTEELNSRAIRSGLALVRKALVAIDKRQYSDRIGCAWRVHREPGDDMGIPEYVGTHGRAWLGYAEDGLAYEVRTFDRAGRALHDPVTRKGLDAALRKGEQLANAPNPQN